MLGKKPAYIGFETFITSLKFNAGMHKSILQVVLASHAIFFLVLFSEMVGFEELVYTLRLLINENILSLETEARIELLIYRSAICFVISLSVWSLYLLIIKFFKSKTNDLLAKKYVKGAKLLTEKEVAKTIKKRNIKTRLKITRHVSMPYAAEIRNTALLGSTGSGKSITTYKFIKQQMALPKSKGIILDRSGAYLSSFYNPKKHRIFNPLDKRSLSWPIMKEVKNVMDIYSIAADIIPDAHSLSTDPFWPSSSRDTLAGLLFNRYQNKLMKNSDIWDAVSAPIEEVAEMLKGYKYGKRGYRYIEDTSSKQALSVLAVLMSFANVFEFMDDKSSDFTIENWLNDEDGGWIFLTSYSEIEATLRPILSLFINRMYRKMLSMPNDLNRRLWMVLDELTSVQRLSMLPVGVKEGRKKGNGTYIGDQDLASIDRIYSKDVREAMFNSISNLFVFSNNSPVSADFLSQSFNTAVYEQTSISYGLGVTGAKDGMTISKQEKEERIVLSSEIKTLKTQECYIKLLDLDAFKTKIKVPFKWKLQSFLKTIGLEHIIKKTKEFIPREDLVLENIIEECRGYTAKANSKVKEIEDEKKKAKREKAKKQTKNQKDVLDAVRANKDKIEKVQGDVEEVKGLTDQLVFDDKDLDMEGFEVFVDEEKEVQPENALNY